MPVHQAIDTETEILFHLFRGFFSLTRRVSESPTSFSISFSAYPLLPPLAEFYPLAITQLYSSSPENQNLKAKRSVALTSKDVLSNSPHHSPRPRRNLHSSCPIPSPIQICSPTSPSAPIPIFSIVSYIPCQCPTRTKRRDSSVTRKCRCTKQRVRRDCYPIDQ